jgi:hypothetical protein
MDDVSKLYIDIESIFDLRMSVMASIYPQVAKDLLRTDDYWLRESDRWSQITVGRVTEAAFKEAYDKRTKDILQSSVMTGIIAPLMKMIAENEIAIIDGRPNREIAIDVNVWPFSFDDEEMEMFVRLFNYRLGFTPRIMFISRPPAMVTPDYLLDNYAGGFMYDFNGWIKLHLSGLIARRAQGFNLVVPRLFEHDVTKMTIEDKQDEVQKFKLWFTDYMLIHFIDASHFSIFRPV